MARKPRVDCPGALYHVMLRGNGGQEIFFSQEDRFRFYLLVQEGMERYGHKVHAFCLMTTHVHLAIQVGEIVLYARGRIALHILWPGRRSILTLSLAD
jgi:putative transposase